MSLSSFSKKCLYLHSPKKEKKIKKSPYLHSIVDSLTTLVFSTLLLLFESKLFYISIIKEKSIFYNFL